ncbi:MAG: OmpA family protein [candidate division Zixibacteria bacterium]|nr:OmpA family protein [candidate division Zixibacteria bacterium]NIR67863.1 OmpA family protein [candidate division Zixibacteria bacterium]NIS15559.1 OmpA family protein [candidate division Zixibacteria bacterium]NIS49088.1 OmpA family protein [candidate division Zixibacteria bacterium]NIT52084.1 OmpA family protein [candidate division Zixibacteria bacterium]
MEEKMRRVLAGILIATLILGGISCSSMSKSEKGAVIGAAAGAVAGGVIGKAAGNTAAGAIMGAAVGGAAGAIIGNYMDKQAAEMERDLEGAKIERVGEGIKITFDSGILFEVNKSDLQFEAQQNLTKLAEILNKYEDTEILIEGHTDSTGPEEYNMDLSIRRANSVGNYLAVQEVSPARFTMMGYGEKQPIAPNETVEGRKQNRRVEIAIFANDKLKKAAQKQAEG